LPDRPAIRQREFLSIPIPGEKNKARLWRAIKKISSEAWVKPSKAILGCEAAKEPNGSHPGLKLQPEGYINPGPKAVKDNLLNRNKIHPPCTNLTTEQQERTSAKNLPCPSERGKL
jgi:hypothetical protein